MIIQSKHTGVGSSSSPKRASTLMTSPNPDVLSMCAPLSGINRNWEMRFPMLLRDTIKPCKISAQNWHKDIVVPTHDSSKHPLTLNFKVALCTGQRGAGGSVTLHLQTTEGAWWGKNYASSKRDHTKLHPFIKCGVRPKQCRQKKDFYEKGAMAQ